jgi:uncharacterized protein YwbE
LHYITTRTSLSQYGFVNYKKGRTRLAAASDKVYQLLAHGRWFSPGTSASSTTNTGRHDIAELSLKVALNTKNQNQSKILEIQIVGSKNTKDTKITKGCVRVIDLSFNKLHYFGIRSFRHKYI